MASTVVETADPQWKVGAKVVVNGRGMWRPSPGGYTRYSGLKSEWLVDPRAVQHLDAMAIGTAGLHASPVVDTLSMPWAHWAVAMYSSPASRRRGIGSCVGSSPRLECP